MVEALKAGDLKQETSLIKAVKKGHKDIALMLATSGYMDYDMLCMTDGMGQNVLHHAVSAAMTELVMKLIYFDSDSGKLRS